MIKYNYNIDKQYKFITTYQELKKRLPYEKKLKFPIKCHWGQRKLLYTEIEFLNLVSKYLKLEECLIVYIGSAPCIHLPIILEMYKNLHFLLIDPAKFLIKESENVRIENKYFTDETCDEVLEYSKKMKLDKIIFISDIRRQNTDAMVLEDLQWQQNWVIKINPEFCMLKFRFPFKLTNKNIPKNVEYINNKINEKYKFCYLAGRISLQIWQPFESAETRLISSKIKYFNLPKKLDGEKYLVINYDTRKYEEKMFYYNTKTRQGTFTFKTKNLNSDEMKKYILGYDKSYDCVREFHIIHKYFKNYLKVKNNNKIIIDKLIYINNTISKLTNRNIILCPIKETIDEVDNHTTEEFLFNKIAEIKNSFENQMLLIKNKKQLDLYDNKKIIYKNKILLEFKEEKIIIYK